MSSFPFPGTTTIVGNKFEEYNLDNYESLRPLDIVVSSNLCPDFLFTFDSNPLLLVMSIPYEHFYETFSNYKVGYVNVEEDRIRSLLHFYVGSLCYLDVEREDLDRNYLLQEVCSLINDLLVRTDLPAFNDNTVEVVSKIYNLLTDDNTKERTLQEILDDFFFSRTYTSYKFKNVTGVNLVDYLRLKRTLTAFNNIMKPLGEVIYLSGFRNEKILKDSLRLVTTKPYKQIRKMMTPEGEVEDPFTFPPFLDFLSYAKSLQPPDSTRSFYSHNEDLNYIIDNYDTKTRSKAIWTAVADFRLFRHQGTIAFADRIREYILDLNYDSFRIPLLADREGNYYVDYGTKNLRSITLEEVRNLFVHFIGQKNIIISLDFFTLNYKSFEEITEEEIGEIVRHAFNKDGLLDFIDYFDKDYIKNMAIELSLGDILDSSNLEEKADLAMAFLKPFSEALKNHIMGRHVKKGLHFRKVCAENLKNVDAIYSRLNYANIDTEFLSLDLDTAPSMLDINNVEHLLYSYKDVIERVGDLTLYLNRKWDVEIYVTHFLLNFNLDLLTEQNQNLFMNTFVIEGINKSSKAIDAISAISIEGEENYYDLELYNHLGFRTMYYYTMKLMNNARGSIIYNRNGCVVWKDDEDFFVLLYSGIQKSYVGLQDNQLLTESWKATIDFQNLKGSFKITKYVLDSFHGDYNYYLKGFDSSGFLTEEEWEYIDAKARPQMTTRRVQTSDNLYLETMMKPFDVQCFKIEQYK